MTLLAPVTLSSDIAPLPPLVRSGWEAVHVTLDSARCCNECNKMLVKGRLTLLIKRTEDSKEKLRKSETLTSTTLNRTYVFCGVDCQRRKYVTMLAKGPKVRKGRAAL